MKPVKQTMEYFDYFEIKDYILEKYNCAKDEDKTWDYMCDHCELRNDSFCCIPDLNNAFTNAIKEEFGEDLEVWISW